MRVAAATLTVVALAATAANDARAGEDAARLLDSAVAWHFGAGAGRPSAGAALKSTNGVDVGAKLSGSELEESVARGGDGVTATFDQGTLVAGKNADQIVIGPKGCTLLLRLFTPPGGWQSAELLRTGSDKAPIILQGNPDAHRDAGLVVTAGGPTRSNIEHELLASGLYLTDGRWHDAVIRCRGNRVDLFVDGLPAAHRTLPASLEGEDLLPLTLGGSNFHGAMDHAALWPRALSDEEIESVSGGTDDVAKHRQEIATAVAASVGRDGLTPADQQRGARMLRERLERDPHRPRYHFVTPEGKWNDINGLIQWKGRYHLFVLGRATPDVETIVKGDDTTYPRETWLHASSLDFVHWVHHPPALTPAFDGSMPRGMYSGDAVDGAPTPTLIYHVPRQGICISTANDDSLVDWTPSTANPVIPEAAGSEEYLVFDPCAWREGDTYYALIGNRNHRPGYAGDSTSLFRSPDLMKWEYVGPFYKSERRWTDEFEDCACPDFFPLGDKYMLLMHTHRPTSFCQYYLGRYENQQFFPERHGRLGYLGSVIGGPETLLDDRGRRIFTCWVREAENSPVKGWTSAAALPRVFSLTEDGDLRQEPLKELESLRYNHRHKENIAVAGGADVVLEDVRGDCLELNVVLSPGEAKEFGVNVRQSDDKSETTPIVISQQDQQLRIEFGKSSQNTAIRYPSVNATRHAKQLNIPPSEWYANQETMPIQIASDEELHLRIFVDRSVVEVFLNDRWCMTQRIYPEKPDSTHVSLFSRGGAIKVKSVDAWDMEATNAY